MFNQHRTLTATITRSLARGILIALVACAFFSWYATQDAPKFTKPAVVNAEMLMTEHDCTNQADPTHAVVTRDGVVRYVGQRVTDMAIEQEMFGIDHGLIVHSFCA